MPKILKFPKIGDMTAEYSSFKRLPRDQEEGGGSGLFAFRTKIIFVHVCNLYCMVIVI